MTLLDRKQCVTLYENAECSGEVALFAATSRDAYAVARKMCAKCPVVSLCYQHVNPEEDSFTGTCAGKLWYEGVDVSDKPETLAPPVFRIVEVDILITSALIDGDCKEWDGHSVSTVMSACWGLRKKHTLNRISKMSGLTKDHVAQLVQAFDDGSPSDFRDFIASQSS